MGGVGRGGMNQAADVRLVQRLLNDSRGRGRLVLLVDDGLVGPKTIAAIELYQRSCGLTADGRVDRGGPTIRRLLNEHVAALSAGIIPSALPVTAAAMPPISAQLLTDALAAYWQGLKK
jgi:peptidoglycan hydrolase-like protein with peptidoglycan-binding domain